MGLCAVAALALEGVRDLAVFGLAADAAQLDLAGRLGATRTGELDEQLPADHASFDLAIETAGHPDAVIAAVRLCRPGGRVVCVGLPSTTVALDTAALAREEKRLIGVRAYDLGEWIGLPRRLGATPLLRELVTHVLDLGDLDRAIDLVASRKATKVLITP